MPRCPVVVPSAVLFVLLVGCGISSSPKQAICKNQVRQIAELLKLYRNQNGRLPVRLSDLVSTVPEVSRRNELQRMLRCPFDEEGSTSYVYIPPHQQGTDQDGSAVIFYCRCRHPETVYSADGDKSAGVVPVIREDLSTADVPVTKFEITIADR